MSDKFKTVVTTQGLELLNQAIVNEKDLLLKKAVASSTAYNSDRLVELTDANYKSAVHDQETTLNRIDKRGDGTLAFEILFDGYDVRYDYTLNTVFLIAEVEDKERLFAVIKANQPQYINAYEGGSRTNLQINFGLQLANQNVAIKINAAALATLGDLNKTKEEFVERIDNVRNTFDHKLQESKSDIENKLSQAKATLQAGISNTEAKVKSYSDSKDKELSDKLNQLMSSHVEQLNQLIAINNDRSLLADRELRNDFEQKIETEKNSHESKMNELAEQLNRVTNDTIKLDSDIREASLKWLRAPTAWTLDRTSNPWTITFDNGCRIQFPDYGTTNTIYGYGYFFANTSMNQFAAFPLVYNIINCARGVLTLEDFIERDSSDYVYWSPTTKVIDPICDASEYDWTSAYGNPNTNSDTLKRKPVFARVMYELGIWSNADVERVGAKRR